MCTVFLEKGVKHERFGTSRLLTVALRGGKAGCLTSTGHYLPPDKKTLCSRHQGTGYCKVLK